jgi:elongation factor Tu
LSRRVASRSGRSGSATRCGSTARAVQIEAVEQFRKKVDVAVAGDNVGLLFSGLDRTDLSSGDVLTSGAVEPASGGVEVSL